MLNRFLSNLTIKSKITILPALAVIALLVIFTVDLYLRQQVIEMTKIISSSHEISLHLSKEMHLQQNYIVSSNQNLLNQISMSDNKVSEVLGTLQMKSFKNNYLPDLHRIISNHKRHNEMFDRVQEVVSSIVDFQNMLTILFHESDELAEEKAAELTLRISHLMLEGKELHPAKKEFRNSLREYIALSSGAMLNLNELLFFSDRKQYTQAEKMREHLLSQVMTACKALSKVTGDSSDRDTWKKIEEKHGRIREFRYSIVRLWQEREELTSSLQSFHVAIQNDLKGYSSKINEDLVGLITRHKWVLSTIIVLTLIFLIMISYILIQHITLPVNLLTEAIHKFKKGEYDFDLKAMPRDEIGTMAKTFKEMISYRKQIDGKIQRSEKELRKSKVFLQRAQEAARMGCWWYDPFIQKTQWTNEMFRVFGLEPQPIVPTHLEHKEIIHPDDWDKFDSAVNKAITEGKDYDLDLKVTYPSGRIGYVNAICKPITNEAGIVSELIGTTRDITDRKIFEIKQSFLQKRLKALWNISSLRQADTKTICDHILNEIIDMTDSGFGIFGFLNDSEDTVTIHSWSKAFMPNSSADCKAMTLSLGKLGIWGNAVRSREAYVLNNSIEASDNEKAFLEESENITRILSIPVVISGKVVALGVVANKLEPYDDDDVSQLQAFLVNAQIIIDQKSHEEKLKAQQTLLSKAQEIGHIGSRHLDLRSQVMTWSEETYRIFGRSPQEFEVTYETFLESIHPDDRDRVKNVYMNCKDRSSHYECIHRIVRPNGEVRTVLEKFENVRDEKHNVIHLFGFTQDITELRKAERALKVSEEKFRSLLESTSTAPWELDLISSKFTYMGPQIEQILGYSVDSWKDFNTWAERLHPDDRSKAVDFCEIETSKGKDHDFTYRAIHKDGSYRWVRDIVSVVCEEDKPRKLVGFMHDITRQKELSLDKEKLKKQLVQTQKLEAIGTLAGGIAHDFNNILAAILGYAEMAKEDLPRGSTPKTDIEKVIQSGMRAKDLVKQILTFSREAEQDIVPIEMNLVVKESLKLLRASIPTTIEIRQNIASNCGVVSADLTQLHQIIMNLCANAKHAMQEKGGVLEVSLTLVEIKPDSSSEELKIAPGSYVRLEVSDTGYGMKEDIVSRIFDPFFTTKERGEGTGLGLSTVHGIVTSYNGAIAVRSTPGQGTTFSVYLPEAKHEALDDNVCEDKVARGGRETILIVDDEVFLAEMLERTLIRLGYNAVAYTNSVEALKAFEYQPDYYDLVITDMTMPKMTGAELSKAILQIRPEFPIILCTGFSETIDPDSSKAIGIKGYIAKPVVKEDIDEIIRELLDKKEDALAGE